jgi:hypothetical protein
MIKPVGTKALGYFCETGPDGFIKERDLFTCQHCNLLIIVEPGSPDEDYGGHCSGCRGRICLGCLWRSRQNDFGGCDHIEKKLNRIEKGEVPWLRTWGKY